VGYFAAPPNGETKAALMFILFHKRVCGPLANSLFHHRPDETLKPFKRFWSCSLHGNF
jgi:hypothetical protein